MCVLDTTFRAFMKVKRYGLILEPYLLTVKHMRKNDSCANTVLYLEQSEILYKKKEEHITFQGPSGNNANVTILSLY